MNNISAINHFVLVIRPLTLGWKFNLKAFYFLSFVLFGILFILSVLQINSVIESTYLIKNYEKEFTLLSGETKNLEIKFAQISTLENIEFLIKDLSYEKIENIRYIQLLGSQVVTK